jgi:hypothetical protein
LQDRANWLCPHIQTFDKETSRAMNIQTECSRCLMLMLSRSLDCRSPVY